MNIFQKSIIKKNINRLSKQEIETVYNRFKNLFSQQKIEKIKTLKEEEYQDGFLRDIFVDILGYTMKPDENFNLVRELKNENDGKKTDAAVVNNNKVLVVIELKSTSTKDLTSVTQQAFNYKNNQADCKYVITSNFQKIRFYIDYAIEYEEFDLFNITKTDFEIFYLILNKDSIFSDLPYTMKQETRFHEQRITEQLYNDYSQFKNKIFENLIEKNPQHDKLILFEKSQKLLDRLLFILFAEDSGLLPANSIFRIIEHFDKLNELDAYRPLYDTYKLYFGYMNAGRKGKTPADDIPAYNGGLFAPDQILDSLIIDDHILRDDSLKLSEYDFSTEVDVNILGHIFEHSLSEIEEMEAKLSSESETLPKLNTTKLNKRKKEGVFYTPRYITQYIVDNTLGLLCRNKRTELGIFEVEFDSSFKTKKGLNEKGKILYDKLNEYKNWLKSLKILDPACGSGAFLNQALVFLIAEHQQIDDYIAELTDKHLRIFDIDKTILENNLYGVDINQESVEIAQLSLWLRTAQKGRQLSILNNNIKCGNSLVDDFAFNYRKAFNWKTEFADIINNGGFDAIIGNPPYIKEYTNRTAFDGLHSHYCYQGKMDLWYFFGCLALELVKKETGVIGFIAPNNWITNAGASKFRNVILEKAKIIEYVDFGNFKVFDTAGIQTMIYIMQRTNDNEQYYFSYSKILDSNINHQTASYFLQKTPDLRFTFFTTEINKQLYSDKPINFINANLKIVIDKIAEKQNFRLEEKEVAQGIVAAPDEAFIVKEKNINNFTFQEKVFLKRFYTNSEKFFTKKTDKFIFYLSKKNFDEDIEKYQNIKNHFEPFKEKLEKAKIRFKTPYKKYYFLHRERDENFFVKGEKIICSTRCFSPSFTFTEDEFYGSRALNFINSKRINLKYLTGLFNSKMSSFWLKYKGKLTGDILQIDKNQLLNIPIITPNVEKQNEIADLVNQIIENKQKEFDYTQLLNQAKKDDNFDREIKLAKELEKIKIFVQTTENQIDRQIYELYNLSENEIAVIENDRN